MIDTYEKLKEIDKRSFLEECKISIPSLYIENIEYIKECIPTILEGLKASVEFIVKISFLITSPVSFPVGILIAKIILKFLLNDYEHKSTQNKDLK